MYGLFLFENDGLLLASTYPSLQLMNDRLAKPQSPPFVYWLFDSICNHNLQKEDQAVINKTYN